MDVIADGCYTAEMEPLTGSSVAVVVHLLRPVAVTYLGVEKEPGVTVIDPKLAKKKTLNNFVSLNLCTLFTRPPLQTKYFAHPDSW